MKLTAAECDSLQNYCAKFRRDLIKQLHSIQTGHPGGSLSCCEILTVLYFAKANIAPSNRSDPERDWIVLSKGHAAPMLYRILAEKGFFPKEELATLRQAGSRLQGHPCPAHTPGVELPSGPLGAAYAACVGVALANKVSQRKNYVYAVLGDGECNEGVIWEAAMSVSKFGLDRLITIVDRNHVQLDGTSDEILPLGDLAAKFAAFGLFPITCDGHDVAALSDAIDTAKSAGKPCVILAETVKGKGVSFMEGKNEWHGKPIGDADYAKATAELGGNKSWE